jgi:selenocysteine lyase/cysteine desulfurase
MIFRILSAIAFNTRKGNIVTTNLDHASSYDAAHILAGRYNMETRVAGLDPKTGAVPVEAILKEIDQDTAALTVIHASNILGSKNDIAKIVGEARKINPDIYVVLDGAQHTAHGRIDVAEYGADAYVFVPYKTYSKAGISFAHISERLADLPHDKLVGKPENYWDLGTREEASYACMSKVVEYMQWLGSHFTASQDARSRIVEGMLAIEGYELCLLKALLHGTSQQKGMLALDNVTVYGEKENLRNREAIVAFNIKGRTSEETVDYFEAHGVRLHNRISDAYSGHTLSAVGIEECIRVSLCHYNTLNEVNTFLALLNNYAEYKEI